MEYKGFEIVESERHGQAVAGTKKTSSIQIRQPAGSSGYLCRMSISFPVGDFEKMHKAIKKAKRLIDEGKFKPIKP